MWGNRQPNLVVLRGGITMRCKQHIYKPICVLKARYLHRAYYTYLIHEITLESVQLYGHNIILSGVVVELWLASRPSTRNLRSRDAWLGI